MSRPLRSADGVAPRVLHVFGSFDPGGAELRTVQLIDAFAGELEHVLVALDGRYGACEWLNNPSAVEVPSERVAGGVRAVRRLVQRFMPDLVASYGWGAFDAPLSCVLGGRGAPPCVHHEDGVTAEELGRKLRRRDWTRRAVLPRVTRVVVPSHALVQRARWCWGVPESKLSWIPNGVAVADPDPRGGAALRAKLGIPAGAPVIAFVGRLSREKDPLRAVSAIAATRAHLVLAGEGPERAAIVDRALASGAAERVHILGWVRDVRAVYAAADLFLSTSRTEQHPLTLLEAMAAGLAVVTTDVGDARRTLPAAQHAWIAEVNAAARSIAALIEEALAADGRRRELGASNARAVYTRHSFERVVADYRAVYAAALQ